jgi:hypothetical protein
LACINEGYFENSREDGKMALPPFPSAARAAAFLRCGMKSIPTLICALINRHATLVYKGAARAKSINPLKNPSIPSINQGMRRKNQEIPSENQGVRRENQAIPSENEGMPLINR